MKADKVYTGDSGGFHLVLCGRGDTTPVIVQIFLGLKSEQCRKWIEGVPRVMCYDLCSACDGSVIEI